MLESNQDRRHLQKFLSGARHFADPHPRDYTWAGLYRVTTSCSSISKATDAHLY